MKIYYHIGRKDFSLLSKEYGNEFNTVNEKGQKASANIPPELLIQFIPVAISLVKQIWVLIQGTPEEREAVRAYRMAKKDAKRKHKIEVLELEIKKAQIELEIKARKG